MDKSLIVTFISWFFLDFPMRIITAGRNFSIWAWRFFSVGLFLRTLFSPWHKDITAYGKGFDIKAWGHAIMWNFISRIMGAIQRIFFIIIGTAVEVFFIAGTIVLFAAWYCIPAIVIYLFFINI